MSERKLESEVIRIINAALRDSMREERYVCAKELCDCIQCITPSWLKNYGHLLPRVQIGVNFPDGTREKTKWGYPLHAIQRMIAENRTELKWTEKK